jgi:prolipoprotein diacylglyceryltransferase
LWLWNRQKQNTPHGILTGLFMIILFTLRFFYEFLKENQSSFEDGLTLNMGQILSIPAVLFGVGVLLYAKRKTT